MEAVQNPTGRLIINVYDETVARPITNAKVIIFGNGIEQENAIEEYTDISGKTDSVFLSAPQVGYSLEPENSVVPFSSYDLIITAEGFDETRIYGVQIFADTSAIQNVYLTPLSPQLEETIEIEPPTLWGNFPEKIPEAEEKDERDETGFVILDRPVIPEYIVVHDGSPNDDSAPNYFIEFKDYIKNVASCEIYSTWPDAAIRANILVIISFTLNRVFTEWYRNRGKNYTITSSTQYDQAFSYGRNIYEEISVVVDEMFTTYITRPNIRQPLFTQYCNGSTSYCPNWLSQWGSKNLADQGYTAIQILKYYYGDDIYLTQAEKVTGVPVSFPGEVLTIGSQGSSVRTIQEQLNAISKVYTAINTLRVDGIFGEQTAEAVREFQRIFDLPQSGVVDFSTWYEISQIFVAIEKLAEL